MTLSGHTDVVEKCFFEDGSLDVITISRNGQAFIWECTLEPSDLIPEDSKAESDTTPKRQVKTHDLRSSFKIVF